MNVLFIILTVITAILMIGIVLVQKSKGGGLSSSFGGGNQVLGVRGTNKFLENATWTLAALILIFSVCSAYTLPKATSEIRAQKMAPAQAAAPSQDVPAPAEQPAAPAATEETAAPAEPAATTTESAAAATTAEAPAAPAENAAPAATPEAQ